jgi:hypothetical protein
LGRAHSRSRGNSGDDGVGEVGGISWRIPATSRRR